MTKSAIVAFALALVTAGCGDSVKSAPQLIVADGDFFSACSGSVWISNEGGGWLGGGEVTFRVKFTDNDGLSNVVKGIKKLRVSELPANNTFCKH